MHLIEILLPVTDNAGKPFGPGKLEAFGKELTEVFGGLTAFTRAPAHGVVDNHGVKIHDSIIILEVMADELDPQWWRVFRKRLEKEFRQDEIMIRATEVVRL